MENLLSKLNSCLIISDDPEELKNSFIRTENVNFKLTTIQQHFERPDCISFIKNDFLSFPKLQEEYCLFIEDEFDYIARFIEASNYAEVIKNLVVCTDVNSAKKFIELANLSPIVIGLDFRLTQEDDWHKYTYPVFNTIKNKWGEVPLIGISQFALKKDENTLNLVNYIRSKKNSVLDKSKVFEALPDILRDKYEIGLLTREKDELYIKVQKVEKNFQKLKDAIGIDLKTRKESGDFGALEEPLIGNSYSMKIIKLHIELAAKDKDNILLLGETGTGKELVAKAIHKLSGKKKDMVIVNCAAIPGELIESELFGHEKGSFTGATYKKIGKFEEANGGTIFLDEIHHMSLSGQSKLLRAIDEKIFFTVGGRKVELSKDTRIIAASIPNIEKLIEDGLFLEDLFGRLNSFFPIIPPLRERGEDILELAQYFITSKDKNARIVLSDEANEILKQQDWKRNVRELKNFIFGLYNLYSGGKEENKNLGQLPQILLIEADHINYALSVHYKKHSDEKLAKKVLLDERSDIAAAEKKSDEPAAKDLLKAILDAIEQFPSKASIKLDEIAEKITMPGKGKTKVTMQHLSSEFNRYKNHFKGLMSSPEFSDKLSIAMKYSKLKKLLKT